MRAEPPDLSCNSCSWTSSCAGRLRHPALEPPPICSTCTSTKRVLPNIQTWVRTASHWSTPVGRNGSDLAEDAPKWVEHAPKLVRHAPIWAEPTQNSIANHTPSAVQTGPTLVSATSAFVEMCPTAAHAAPGLAQTGPNLLERAGAERLCATVVSHYSTKGARSEFGRSRVDFGPFRAISEQIEVEFAQLWPTLVHDRPSLAPHRPSWPEIDQPQPGLGRHLEPNSTKYGQNLANWQCLRQRIRQARGLT